MKNPLLRAWLAVESYVYWMEENLGFFGFVLAILSASLPLACAATVLIIAVGAWLAAVSA